MPASSPRRPTPTCRAPSTTPSASASPSRAISGRPPAVGENNEDVLRELAYSEDEIEALKKAGALG